MKFQACLMILVIALFSCATAARFGPHNCVQLAKSQQGTCVLSTDCAGVDTSSFDFSFDCESSGNRLRHSFGVGGFDDQEEFDTSIKCDKCIASVPVSTHKEVAPAKASPVQMVASSSTSQAQKAATAVVSMNSRGPSSSPQDTGGQMHVHFLASTEEKKAEKGPEKVKYGPADCVSTWRDGKSGHCQVQTDCVGQNTTNYMFGLICKDDTGKTRHLFGKDSFDAQESFDTLIVCKECLALDNVTKATELEAENNELATEVGALAGEVKAIKGTFSDIEKDVKKLNEAVAIKEGGAKKEEKAEEKKEETKEGEGEKKKEGAGEKKEESKDEKKDGEEKKDDAAKEGEAAETKFYLTDRDVDENLPYDSIAKSHLKGSASHVKKQRNSQKKRQRHQKSQEQAEEEDADVDDDDDDDYAEDENTKSQHHFRKKAAEKVDTNDESNDSAEDGADVSDTD